MRTGSGRGEIAKKGCDASPDWSSKKSSGMELPCRDGPILGQRGWPFTAPRHSLVGCELPPAEET